MGFILPVYMLKNVGVNIKSNKNTFLGSHKNVALGVLCGDYKAGAVKEEVFYEYQGKGLKVLASTPKIPGHIFIASKDMSAEKINKIRKALFELKNSEKGKEIMMSIKKSMTAMIPVKDNYYDELRKILIFVEKEVN